MLGIYSDMMKHLITKTQLFQGVQNLLGSVSNVTIFKYAHFVPNYVSNAHKNDTVQTERKTNDPVPGHV